MESARGAVGMAELPAPLAVPSGAPRWPPGPAACAPFLGARARSSRSQQLGRDQGVAGGAVARSVLEAEAAGQVVEPAGADAAHQPPGQPHGAEPGPVQRQRRAPAAARRSRSPSRTGRCGRRRSRPRARPAPGRPARRTSGPSRTISSVMLVMAQMPGGIGRPGLTSESNDHLAPPAVHHDHRDLGDPVAARRRASRWSPRPPRRRRSRRAAASPAPPPPAPSARRPVAAPADRRRAARSPPARRPASGAPGSPSTWWQRVEAAPAPPRVARATRSTRCARTDAPRRRSQRPPVAAAASCSGARRRRAPARCPSIVITVRCLASLQSSKARKLTDGHHPEAGPLQLAQRRVVAAVAHDRARPHREEVARRAPLLPLLRWCGGRRRRSTGSSGSPTSRSAVKKSGISRTPASPLPAMQHRQPLGSHEERRIDHAELVVHLGEDHVEMDRRRRLRASRPRSRR